MNRQTDPLRSLTLSVLILAGWIGLWNTDEAAAQAAKPGTQAAEPQVPTLLGTVSEIKKKGTLTTLVIASSLGGDPVEVTVTPKLQFAVQAKGDDGFLREKQFVSGTGFVTNNTFYVQEWTVHVGPAAKRMQASFRNLPDKDEKGEAKNQTGVKYMQVSAQLMAREPTKDDPERETAILKIGGLKGTPALFDKKASITVSTSDPSFVKEGSEVEYVQTGNPKRPTILALKVTLAEPLKSEEYFAAEEDREKPKN